MREWNEDELLDSCLLEQDRICGVMFCMCIDRGCFVKRGYCGSGVKMCCWTAVCWNRTGYMELCCVCVLTEVVLGQGRMWDRIEDMLLDSL